MRKDHRPYSLKHFLGRIESAWSEHFIAPQLETLGAGYMIMKPWYLKIHGKGIGFGKAVHVVTSRDRTVRLTTWEHKDGHGHIEVADHALLCPGVRIDSATRVIIGESTMLAAGVYVTDADWHDLYDRSQPIGATEPVVLEENVWIGDGSTVCKGVRVGANTIVGTGSIVTKSLPANVIAAGNPAKVIRELDPDKPLRTRADMLCEPGMADTFDQLERMLRKENTWWNWFRSLVKPTRAD